MAKYRRGRINDEVRNELAVILRGVKDPRINEAFLSVTAAEVTPDLKYAKIYYSHLHGDPVEVAKGLKSSAGYIRRMLARGINLRITPELTFFADDSITHGAHISKLLNNLEYSEDSSPSADNEDIADDNAEGDSKLENDE